MGTRGKRVSQSRSGEPWCSRRDIREDITAVGLGRAVRTSAAEVRARGRLNMDLNLR